MTFGLEIGEINHKWFGAALYGQATGGLQVIENNLFVGVERIPRHPDIGFYAGGGMRGEAMFHIPRLGSYFFSLGMGTCTEYLKAMDQFVHKPQGGIHYSVYGLVRLSRETRKTELQLKQ